MKRAIFLFILTSILIVTTTEGADIEGISLRVTFVNQKPYPAEPGEYVDLLFKVENYGIKRAENVVFELLPEYPFSLDPDTSAIKELGAVLGTQTDENAFLIKYKVRVDKYAIDGENEIKLKYTYGAGGFEKFYVTKAFNITVSNPRTDFDVVVQDSAATFTTLIIANTGANTAYSVIVKIPEQEGFEISGPSAYVIGTINAGNYTSVDLPVISLKSHGNLIVEIHYTDKIGIRRIIQKNITITQAFAEDFDVVVQDSTETSTMLAIANIGSSTAYSVIVKIPEQKNYRVTGVSTSLLGNIGAGEYALSSFQLTPIRSAFNTSADRSLIVEISYTDALGIRRTITKEVRLDTSMKGAVGEATVRQVQRQTQATGGSGLVYIGVGTIGIIAIVVFFRFRKRKKK
ncbi:MAG: hypothetical protein QXQ40_01280 [Candidatus Aenigmatarchaeota archaeon]